MKTIIDHKKLETVLGVLAKDISKSHMITETSARIGTLNDCEVLLFMRRLGDDEWEEPHQQNPKHLCISK